MIWTRKLVLGLLLICIAPAQALADRVALVIGNASYQSGALRNPVNDAADVSAKLRSLGFQVLGGNNLDREGMVRQMQAFRSALKPGGVGLFFYSGHGVEVNGRNYLLPVNNGAIQTVEDVEVYGLEAQRLVSQMEASGTQLNVVILDACRDNPLPSTVRSASKGLGRMDAQQGTVIAYATKEGQVAADGSGRNSPYTQALLKYLGEPGLEVAQLFNRVGLEVSTSTRGVQVPWVSSSPVPPVMLAGVGTVARPEVTLPAGEGLVQIDVYPTQAQVFADGALLGSGARELRFPSGTRVKVEVRADGHKPFEQTVLVQGGKVVDVLARLESNVAPAPQSTATGSPRITQLSGSRARNSYMVGAQMGTGLKPIAHYVDIGMVEEGLTDVATGRATRFSEEQANEISNRLRTLYQGAGAALQTPSERQDNSYVVGMTLGKSLKDIIQLLDLPILRSALLDRTLDRGLLMSEEELTSTQESFTREVGSLQESKKAAQGDVNARESRDFLERNRNAPGVRTLSSGLQYKVLREGSGRRPTATDTVKVHYVGTLIDGTKFDSSRDRGQPAQFPLNAVIAGWTEGLQLMREGGKAMLYIPPELAYGEKGTQGPIGPNATLVFEVELLSVVK